MDKKINTNELKLDVPTEKGFRRGVTKRSIIKGLTEEDWHRIDAMKEAEERKVDNKLAYKLFIASDQLVMQKEQLMAHMRELIGIILEHDNQIKRYKVDISTGDTEEKNEHGNKCSMEELNVSCFRMETNIFKSLSLLRMDLSRLYIYIGRKGLDMKVMFNEKDYENTVDWVQQELSRTNYKLL